MSFHVSGRFGIAAALALSLLQAPDAGAAPLSVTVAGSLQSELGCPGDWQPECAATHLAYNAAYDVWRGEFAVPAGNWEYKAALDDSWTENYGANATPNGANIPFTLAAGTNVRFYYDHKSHWIASSADAAIAVLPGSFQSELGCAGDWDPACLLSWLTDPDGNGIYSFVTGALPAGSYETKVAHNEAWDENYGAGGVANGANIPFVVPFDGAQMMFLYDAATHLLQITAPVEEQVTEPATVLLTALGLAALGLRRRRRA